VTQDDPDQFIIYLIILVVILIVKTLSVCDLPILEYARVV